MIEQKDVLNLLSSFDGWMLKLVVLGYVASSHFVN